MANPYIYNVVTVDGAALIAQATAANPIVYVGALSKATAAESDADLATKPASWYDGKAGEIVSVSATGSVARIVAVWQNAGAAQPAKSLAVTARLASQTDADAVVLTAMSDPDSSIILPASTGTQGGVEVPFNLDMASSGTATVTPGAAASVADLARFVSIHSAVDPNVGDAQMIKGEKTFVQNVYFNSTDGTVSIEDAGIMAPDGNIDCFSLSVANGGISATGGISTTGGISAGGNLSATGNLEVHGSSEFQDDVEISTGDLNLLIGSVVAAGDVDCHRVICATKIDAGTGQNRIRADGETGTLTAKKVEAVLPYPAAGHEPPVGGYAMIAVTLASPSAFEVVIGQVFDGHVDTIKTACYFTQSATGTHYYGVKVGHTSLSGKYVACADAYSGTDTTCYFLAQRID